MLTQVTGENDVLAVPGCKTVDARQSHDVLGKRRVTAAPHVTIQIVWAARLIAGCASLGSKQPDKLFTTVHNSKLDGCKLLIWRALQDSNLRPPGS
jgi:hypothetical protein